VPRPLSVLYFSNSLVRGGAEEHILTLVRGLDRTRFRAHLACTPEVERALRPDLPEDVELTPLRLRRPRHVGAALALARVLRNRQIDVLHSHLFYASLFASPVAWLCRVRAIVETPHVREHWRRGQLKGRFVVDRFVGRFVDRYIAVSEANARYLVVEKRLPARKITVIHNGCDVERFDPAHRPPPELRASLGIGPSDPVALVLGRLEPQKGHHVLLDAFSQIQRRWPGAHLVCVGEGVLRAELESRVGSLGLTRTVHLVGYQRNVVDWLALADVTVLPSFYEGLPLAAIESLAAGRPVVATGVDGTPEVVLHGRTGLLVQPGDVTGLATAVCQLFANPDEGRRLGHAGRIHVTAHFDQRQQVRDTGDLYTAAVEGRGIVSPVVPDGPTARSPR
jgi:glycosyltransferase involved in cell wall biosynthesis